MSVYNLDFRERWRGFFPPFPESPVSTSSCAAVADGQVASSVGVGIFTVSSSVPYPCSTLISIYSIKRKGLIFVIDSKPECEYLLQREWGEEGDLLGGPTSFEPGEDWSSCPDDEVIS